MYQSIKVLHFDLQEKDNLLTKEWSQSVLYSEVLLYIIEQLVRL